ncbi:major facilitator superfamily domain-containing protein [Mycena alexandri]|uniref:Major facilitator superfamily domain-containing protein n=1 Tax=Mycena alexandri TaxID=1745969 RepID=A0AAD6SEI8_9AGAR|nr:major facilitator superfamily domain-containing protein [Mycena alexandri]
MPNDVDETSSLLSRPKKSIYEDGPTPLPKLQLALILLVQICEPLSSQSIYPYINQLLRELDITGGDERKVGYYACESMFYVTEALTILQWSRASDRIGRKPILLIGLFGTAMSMLLFGLSRTFWGFVLSRCLTGLLNGNTGVMKSTMGDLTDASNRAQGFSYLPLVWCVGASLGSLVGTLSHPYERFPNKFQSAFWRVFPYFAPCAVAAILLLLGFLVVLALFEETAPQQLRRKSAYGHVPRGPLPLRKLCTFPVIISVSNYVAIAFLHTTFGALLPLFLATSIEVGGLGLLPSQIGVILALDGAVTGIFQIFLFPTLVRQFGERRVVMIGLTAFLPMFALFPLMNTIAAWPAWNSVIWILIACLIALDALMNPCYGCIFVYITTSAPKCSRGTVNGLAQTSASISRAIGPALAASLFSLSATYSLLGGYLVYAVFVAFAALALLLARQLPPQVWAEEVDEGGLETTGAP